jgi:hypothetical protein
MRPGDSVVLNLDPHYEHGGTHWVAARISSEAPIVYYFDSFGFPPPMEVVNAARPGRGILYADSKRQKINESNCGFRAAQFLEKLYDGSTQKKEIETFKILA